MKRRNTIRYIRIRKIKENKNKRKNSRKAFSRTLNSRKLKFFARGAVAKSERCFFRTRKDSGSRLVSRLAFFSRATDNFSTCHEGMTLGVFLPLRTWEIPLRSRGFFTQETALSGPGGVPRAGLEFCRRQRRRLDGEGYIIGDHSYRLLLPGSGSGIVATLEARLSA